MIQVLKAAKPIGLKNVTPVVLSSGGNLIIHLSPYPLVARIALVLSKDEADAARNRPARELQISRYLDGKGIPVLKAAKQVDPGPYEIDGSWMTLWNYAPPAQLQPLSPSEGVDMVSQLAAAMKDYKEPLPALGVWERTCRSAERLTRHSDERIQGLLRRFHKADELLRLEPGLLTPCHGDAHARNLMPSPEGWLWADFEDACLMPAYWDLASFVCNRALFEGLQEPTFSYMWDQAGVITDRHAFVNAVTARVLMSTIGNLDYALEGYGDLKFARRQLELAEPFISRLNQLVRL